MISMSKAHVMSTCNYTFGVDHSVSQGLQLKNDLTSTHFAVLVSRIMNHSVLNFIC